MKQFLQSLLAFIKPQGLMGLSASKRTVNGALIHFNRAMDDLRIVEEQETAEVARQERMLVEVNAALEASRREAVRARNAAVRIASIIGEEADDFTVSTKGTTPSAAGIGSGRF